MSITLSLGPRVRKSPYFEAARKAGLAAASVYNHMYMPTGYGDPAAEYDRLVNGVAMWDVAVERQVALKGPDALALARYLTPRNLDGLAIGQGKYAPICNYEGALINDPVLLQVSDDEIWLSIADSDIKLWAGGIAGARGMDVRVFEPDVSPLAIQGRNHSMSSPISAATGYVSFAISGSVTMTSTAFRSWWRVPAGPSRAALNSIFATAAGASSCGTLSPKPESRTASGQVRQTMSSVSKVA